MSLSIHTNLPSLFAQRQLRTQDNWLDRSLTRLASGRRVNSAVDDAAGLAISERMRAQVRGSDQAARNLNDGVSLLQTADGALDSVVGSLQRMRELAVQAANGTLSAADRQTLQQEVNQHIQRIEQISRQTSFNGEALFDQNTAGVGGDPNRRAVLDGLRLGWLEEAERRIKNFYGIIGDGQLTMNVDLGTSDGVGGALASVSTTSVGGNGQWQNITLNVDMADFTPPNLPNGGSAPYYNDRIIAHEMVHAEMSRSMNFAALPSWFKEGMAEFIHGADERLVGDYAGGAGLATILTAFNADDVSASAGYSAGYAAVRYLHQSIKAHGGQGIKDITTYLAANPAATLDAAISNASRGAFASLAAFGTAFNANAGTFVAGLNLSNADTGAIGGYDADGGAVMSATDVYLDTGTRFGEKALDGFKLDVPDYPTETNSRYVSLQAGAAYNAKLEVAIGAVNANALGIADVDVSTLPQFALVHIDEAIQAVAVARSRVGAGLSRLEFATANLTATSLNLQASRSRIVDTDYASETAELSRNRILRQAGNAILVQANSQPKTILRLLRQA
ncbi:flagellinolysin [Rhodocyclus tenuis]|uniref:Flagellin n=1 Tax=Rhodocyclus tenuis TaxID=1066 RepID=A0A840GB10_RHOTE|nr:flagellinolysin [Rhodocyclus tenuis]MBB4249055.1 flagellin [Rhodocyclus tenuis]